MKQLFLLLFVLSVYGLELPVVNGQSEEDYLLLNKYWTYRDRFYRNFIRIDWGGDGIGTFEEFKGTTPNTYYNGRYAKAGFSLPASQHFPTWNAYYWRMLEQCQANPEAADLKTANGILDWGEDAIINLGLYLSVLATEHKLLTDNNQSQHAAKTLEEIYLALQAYRRLNMTANHWIERYEAVAPDFECKEEWTPDYTGYSGVTIRDDVPYEFHHEFRTPTLTNSIYTNPVATDEYGRASGVAPNYNCISEPDGIPDVQLIAGNAACGARKTKCGHKDGPFIGDKVNELVAREIKGEKFLSHDQTIGLLVGLKLVHVLLPTGTTFAAPSGSVDIRAMVEDIAESLILNLRGSQYEIPCLGRVPNRNLCGHDWTITYGGICDAIGGITGAGTICSVGAWDSRLLALGFKSQFNYITLPNGSKVPYPVPPQKPVPDDPEKSNVEQRQMNYTFYQSLAAINASEPVFKVMRLSNEYAPWIEPYYPLLHKALLNYQNITMVAEGFRDMDFQINYYDYIPKMQAILGSYGCQGNCVPSKDVLDCTIDYPVANIVCDVWHYYRPSEITGNRISAWVQNVNNYYGHGLDYMLMYNLYHLAFLEDMNYYDTKNVNNINSGNVQVTDNGSYPISVVPPMVIGTDLNPTRKFGDAIETSATILVNLNHNGGVVHKAAQSITLKPGFLVQPGASYHGLLGERPQCGIAIGSNTTYYRQQQDNGSQSANAVVDQSYLTATQEQEKNTTTLKVYPNPVLDHATIEFRLPEEHTVMLDLMDLNGRVLRNIINDQQLASGYHQHQLSMEGVASGIYFVRLIHEGGVHKQQIIVSH